MSREIVLPKKVSEHHMLNNSKIALFMGAKYWPKSRNIFKKYSDAYEFIGAAFGPNQLRYHESWNWLISVVQRIEKSGYLVEITFGIGTLCRIWNQNGTISATESNDPIEAVYNAVLEFIEFKNQPPKPKVVNIDAQILRKARKAPECQCIYEIENGLPRTKMCHIPCKAQRNTAKNVKPVENHNTVMDADIGTMYPWPAVNKKALEDLEKLYPNPTKKYNADGSDQTS